jgi:hypothetical protein
VRKAFLATREELLATWEYQASEDAVLDLLSSPMLIKPMPFLESIPSKYQVKR